MKNNRDSPDPEINRRRLAAVAALIDISAKFVVGIERGTEYSRAGYVVATDYIYNIEWYIVGEVQPHHVREMVKPLARRVSGLLENAKEMHTFFGTVQTDVDKLEYNLNDDDAYISNYIANVEAEIERARDARDAEGAFAAVFAVLTPFVPIVAPLALGLGNMALEDDGVVQESKHLRNTLHHSLNDVRHLKTIVEGAKRATAAQIQYWSETLNKLAVLDATSRDWLEDPSSKWMAEKALARWKMVLQKYSECSHSVSDAGRYIQGRLQLLSA
ncbi:hypothetical protein BDZ94DRAFT_1259132 [Collybia nuda]|uniref:Uncharacterized protein n=1 Tax=Collybia nuda TaxID=64659 RepID=A0A9P5Y8Q2_9AGAR|nr:hypothetical protein BDZ94DRAFT_1259132 [Collybia nuda]